MAVQTELGHVIQAQQFAAHTDLYFVLGRDQDWNDPSNPDTEDENAIMITNPLAVVKVDRLVLCYPSDDPLTTSASDGDDYIVYKDKQWKVISANSLFNANGQPVQDARYVCLIGTLDVGVLPTFDFTQIGVVSGIDDPNGNTQFGVSIASNAPSQHEASKENVLNWGELLFYENRLKESYTSNSKLTVKYMIKF